jgi:hypothetical protein
VASSERGKSIIQSLTPSFWWTPGVDHFSKTDSKPWARWGSCIYCSPKVN